MKLVFDTSAYALCDTGSDLSLGLVEKSEALFLPVIVYGELYYGFHQGTRFEVNVGRLDHFIDHFGVRLIEVDRDVARRFGEIYASLRKKGRPIPTNDIWISACCMNVGGTLLTADRHFLDVPQIEVKLIPSSP